MAAEVQGNRWQALLRLTRSWRMERDIRSLLDRVVKETAEFLGLQRAAALLVSRDGLEVQAVWPEPGGTEQGELCRLAMEIGQKVVQSGRPVFGYELRGREAPEDKDAPAVCTVHCVPMTSSSGVLGALYVDSPEAGKGVSRQDREFMEMLGLQAAVVLESSLFYRSAITDPLTGLFSHRYFQNEIEQAIRHAVRTEKAVSVVIMDLDDFKQLNDTFGHEIGNQCLMGAADVLRSTLRSTDIIARFGGDEFEVLLLDIDSNDAIKVVDKVRQKMAELKIAQDVRVSISAGIASFPDNAVDAQALFLRADEALYEAKKDGGNRVLVSSGKADKRGDAQALRGRETVGDVTALHQREGIVAVPRPPAGAPIERPASTVGEPVTEQIDGHRVIGSLGAGSMAEVLLVEQPDLGREVALKRPLTPMLDAEQVEAFVKEAKVTASLRHPGVITVYTMGRDADGRLYYTMEPLHGRSLAEILQARREGDVDTLHQFTQRRLLEVLQRVAETIAYAHKQGALHLDLVPSNVMVGEFGEVTVIDWGQGTGRSGTAPAAKASPASDDAGNPPLALLIGVPEYAAPEQLPGSTIEPGAKSDVFSLGAILYEILAGRPPYSGETVEETVQALRDGNAPAPEELVPDEGIEPGLSEICMSALQADPDHRPTAAEFADRLGRHMRGEREWQVTCFGRSDTPLREEEWSKVIGDWQTDGDEWVTENDGEAILVWRTPVLGDFRFICEGWVEDKGELAIIGYGPDPDGPRQRKYDGYCFQFGAEYQTTTKLARLGEDVLAAPGAPIEPGRRYRLEMSYEDGRVRCFLNGEQVFVYRELVPFHGTTIGFYAYAAGTHLRPIEIRSENWGLQMPAIKLADDLLRHGFNEVALERYTELADRNAHRLEGQEARLKAGICLARLHRIDEAHEVFQLLHSTPMGPFAMAEEAALEFEPHLDMDPRRGAEIFQELSEEYPGHQANARVMDVARVTKAGLRSPMFSFSLAEDLEIRADVLRVARNTFSPPALSQIEFQYSLSAFQLRLARWKEALDNLLEFVPTLRPQQEGQYDIPVTRLAIALANGREDLIPAFPGESYYMFPSRFLWDWDARTHWMVRSDDPEQYLHELRQGFDDTPGPKQRLPRDVFLAYLVCGQSKEATDFFSEHILPTIDPIKGAPHYCYWWGTSLTGTRLEELFGLYIDHLGERSAADQGAMNEHVARLLQARWSLEKGDMEAAARLLETWPYTTREFHHVPEIKDILGDACLFQVLLASLGILEVPKMDDLRRFLKHHLAGVRYDMGRMFVGEKPPKPDEQWPHPGWRPEWRLWLALWLEANGDRNGAREVAAPALDQRYGLTHSQPPLEALLARIGN